MQSDSNERPKIGIDHQLPASTAGAEQPKRSGTVRIIVWVLLLLIFAAAFYWILHRHDDTAKPATSRRGAAGGTATINTVTARKGDIGVYLDNIGTVTPVYTSSITSQVSGIILSVHYKEGQLVRKGEPLIDVDPRTYEATLLEARGTLEKDEAVLAQAQMDLERYKAAWAKNAIPKQTLDDQEKIVLQDQGTVKNDQGTVAFDRVQLEYCHIVSPITGRIGLRLVDPGNVVQSSGGTTLAVITQITPITVVFAVPEDNLGQVETPLHKGAKLTVDAYDRAALKQIATGTLLTVDNQINTTTGTVLGRATFANTDSSLYPNQFVNTRLLVNTLQDATLIPSSAIQHNGQVAFVYVIQNNVAHLKNVKAGVTDGDTTQVTGIDPGDVLANSSFDKLEEGAKVAISNKPVPVSTTSGSTAP